MLLVSLFGSVLLWPLILLNHCLQIGDTEIILNFFAVVLLMFFEHKRRVSKLLLPAFISYTYVLYRVIIFTFYIIKMNKKIIIAGGTGFIGNYLAKKFINQGHEVIVISRQANHVNWNNSAAIIQALENATMLINLAGKSVDCRYNEKNKQAIFDSRINTTQALGEAILLCKNPPPIWINSSTATIYRHAEDRPMTEGTGEIGSGFSVNVATKWEKTFFDFILPNTRQVALRMAIVLGKEGGVIKPITNLVRYGLGGKQGNGNQMFSWIHVEDLFNVILFLQQHNELHGVFNTVAPNPISNKTLMQMFRKYINVSVGLPAPKWLLKIGAVLIKTETELILKSRWVIPEKLLSAGYKFKFATIDEALKNIFKPDQSNPKKQ